MRDPIYEIFHGSHVRHFGFTPCEVTQTVLIQTDRQRFCCRQQERILAMRNDVSETVQWYERINIRLFVSWRPEGFSPIYTHLQTPYQQTCCIFTVLQLFIIMYTPSLKPFHAELWRYRDLIYRCRAALSSWVHSAVFRGWGCNFYQISRVQQNLREKIVGHIVKNSEA
jgi:hypothetical protein